MASPTLTNLGGLASSPADLSGTADLGNLLPYPVVQKIKRYFAFFDGRCFGAMRLGCDVNEICDMRIGLMHDMSLGA